MGISFSSEPITLPDTPPQNGVTRIHVAGFPVSPHTGRARNLAHEIQTQFPDQYETWFSFNRPSVYRPFLAQLKSSIFAAQLASLPENAPLRAHKTSPIVWLQDDKGTVTMLGGRDRFSEWATARFGSASASSSESDGANVTKTKQIMEWATTAPGWMESFFDNSSPGTSQKQTNYTTK